jgi:hypothetical protein
MPAPYVYNYCIVRIVPRVDLDDSLVAGVILYCRERRYLGVRLTRSFDRLHVLAPELDFDQLQANLDAIQFICQGASCAGALAKLTLIERFRWLTAPRSTVLQPGPVHSGLCADPASTLDRLATSLNASA